MTMNILSEADTEWGRALERNRADDSHGNEDARVLQQHYDDAPEEDETVEIAIVGGGLAGLAVAIGLHRAGISSNNNNKVKVYERAPHLRSSSQGMLALQANGQKALEKIHPDILHLALEAGYEIQIAKKTTIDEEGDFQERVRTGVHDQDVAKYGRSKIGITWHWMQRTLANLLPDNMVETNRSLQRYEEEYDCVKLFFENGTVVRTHCVLACDGIFSAARRQMFPQDSPIYFGQLNWGSILETNKLPKDAITPNAIHYVAQEGEPRWMAMLNDGGSGLGFWQIRVVDPAKALSLSGNNGRGGLGLPGVKESLIPIAEPFPMLASIIEHTPEEQIFERSIVGLYPLPTWRAPKSGRIALVGDAAHGMHPNIGQGANSAFESAAVVVDAILKVVQSTAKDGQVDYTSALASYERLRKPRADLVQQYANMMGVLQATGSKPVTTNQQTDMTDWILLCDSSVDPPAEVAELLTTFDPCDSPGVSLLW